MGYGLIHSSKSVVAWQHWSRSRCRVYPLGKAAHEGIGTHYRVCATCKHRTRCVLSYANLHAHLMPLPLGFWTSCEVGSSESSDPLPRPLSGVGGLPRPLSGVRGRFRSLSDTRRAESVKVRRYAQRM